MGIRRLMIISSLAIYILVITEAVTFKKDDDSQNRWWYAPSRKAHLHVYKYQNAIRNLNRLAEQQDVQMRLPTDVLPIRYALRLLPFLEEGNFTTHGHVDIFVDCKSGTDKILLNAADLIFIDESIKVVENGTNITVPPNNLMGSFHDEQNTREIVTIHLTEVLKPGAVYKISIDFISKLNDELRGFYRSSYEENGVKKWLAVSQMEAPDARRSFPCFDEPSMKAEFSIVLGRKAHMAAISNMPKISSNPVPDLPPGYVWDYFNTTVKMSSYLVAYMISEFAEVKSPSGLSNTSFAIWARPSFQSQTNYSKYLGPMILEYYVQDYFQIPFPLPKVDMAAIPDFAAGAMENWGLITYREADLLYDPSLSSASAKQRVAIIIAHELAHQWFGNLVTMEWWNVLWLNEGFASYMEYPGTHAVEPGMEMNEQFTVTDLHYVFGIDALESSRPIDFNVNTPNEINQMFDAISYEKGSCIIRMCANFMTEPVFRKGIRRYLEDNAYGNTVQDHLWTALETEANNNSIILPTTVKNIMNSWTSQMGYPVITVTRNYDANQTALISQKRFLLFKNSNSTDSAKYSWYVPLTFTSNFSDLWPPMQWLEKQENRTIQLSKPHDTWVIFNVGQEGYYRVIYDDRNLQLIKNQLMTDHEKISKKNRAQILDDYLNAARAGLVTYPTALELTRYLNKERDYAPWTAASVALDFIDIMLYGSKAYQAWKDYLNSPVISLYNYIKFNESAFDTHLQNFTRSTAVNWACLKLDHKDCIISAQKAYDAWINNRGISPNLRRLISCTAMAFGGDTEYNFAYSQYLSSTISNEKTDMLRAITCPRDRYILLKLLNEMINPNGDVRLQDAMTLFRGVASNPIGHDIAMDFVADQWDDIYSYFKSYEGFGGGTMSTMFRALCDRVNSESKLNKLKKIHDDHKDVLGNSKSVRQGLELAEANVNWITQNYQTIMTWLNEAAPINTTPINTNTPPPPSSTSKPNKASQSFVVTDMYYVTTLALLASTLLL